jgi:serine/threonine protein kinase
MNTETTATLNYMSPESMAKSIYTEKSDIYSFGITSWELIHEREAFEGLDGFNLIESVVVHKQRPPIDKKCGNSLRVLMCDCWDDNPDKRPNSKELCFRLKKIVSELKI